MVYKNVNIRCIFYLNVSKWRMKRIILLFKHKYQPIKRYTVIVTVRSNSLSGEMKFLERKVMKPKAINYNLCA